MLEAILIFAVSGFIIWWLHLLFDASAGGAFEGYQVQSRAISLRAKRWIAAAIALGICAYALELYWLGLI